MTPQWITAACALVAVAITLIGILVNPFKKLDGKLDDLDERTKTVGNQPEGHTRGGPRHCP